MHDESGFTGAAATTGVLGLAIVFGLWWVYFDFIARRPPRENFRTALSWVYLHLVTVATVTMPSVGLGLLETTLREAPAEPTNRRSAR